ncbi:hypothetical protein [Flagellimonas sp. S3867]|uniref:hypothetical protein n=1 Tax=Flagellimonas sp. S3867 TaxID=2768063 RepID=UPI0016842D0C|nr:hypothetical protein [Flagellimonas sp. S3867]
MSRILILAMASFVMMNFNVGFSQDSIHKIPLDPTFPETAFDFWVGKWEVTWDEGDGKQGKGVNRIAKILDEIVIHEDFRVLAGQNKGFKGTSISVYQSHLSRWKQAWADNQGGYYDFLGEIDGTDRIFKTKPTTINGKNVISRMVFKNIKRDSFTWDWESTYDDGKSWKLLWRVNYKRILL